MRLSSMRYKNYTWPHNPETFVVEYRRQMEACLQYGQKCAGAVSFPFSGKILSDY